MTTVEWILVVILSVVLFIFLIAGIILAIKLIRLADEARKIVETGQHIATKADDIVDNVKGMTSVGGIVKTFANRVIEKQERKYAAKDATEAAAEEVVNDIITDAVAESAAKKAQAESSRTKSSKK